MLSIQLLKNIAAKFASPETFDSQYEESRKLLAEFEANLCA
jgi:hypothetical protein